MSTTNSRVTKSAPVMSTGHHPRLGSGRVGSGGGRAHQAQLEAAIARRRNEEANLLHTCWHDPAWIPMLNPHNVMDYFMERTNPFYDRTCNNEVLKMQRANPEQLGSMVGVEYCLLYVQEPILYVVRKQHRSSPSHVVPSTTTTSSPASSTRLQTWPLSSARDCCRQSLISSRHSKRPEVTPSTTRPEDIGGTLHHHPAPQVVTKDLWVKSS